MQVYIKKKFDSYQLDPDESYPMCEWCLIRYADDVDHIRGRRGSLMLDPKNLIFLCRPCHINKGGYAWKEKAERLVLSRLVSIWGKS